MALLGADGPVNLKRDGAFAFPQAKAEVLCDNKDLRLSSWNDAKYLYVQAVVWADGDDSLGETGDGRPIGDTSDLILDVDADQKVTPKVDRSYHLNPWPNLPGLRYSVLLGPRSSSYIKSDSTGRGSIRYLDIGKAQRVRVDSFVIPLAEIEKKPGDKIRLAYSASSPKPALRINSIGEKGGFSFANGEAWKKFHAFTLADRPESLKITDVPLGQTDKIPLARKPLKALPKVGSVPPEVTAKDWLNAKKPPTLASLKGKVVLIDFWATWCGPCVELIPHLNKLHDDHGEKGLVILSFTDQSKSGIENFMKRRPMKYTLGTGSELASEYGVSGLPHAFLIGKDGKLLWQGSPHDKGFDERILEALKAKK
jgi:thiol-disulfide isomerase/thioredoxin